MKFSLYMYIYTLYAWCIYIYIYIYICTHGDIVKHVPSGKSAIRVLQFCSLAADWKPGFVPHSLKPFFLAPCAMEMQEQAMVKTPTICRDRDLNSRCRSNLLWNQISVLQGPGSQFFMMKLHGPQHRCQSQR